MISFEQILDIENAIERAWMKILGDNAYQEFSDATKTTPGYEVKLNGVAATGEKKIWKRRKLDRQWRGILETRIVTTRFQNSDQHSALLVRARMEAQEFLYRFVDETLPFHWVTFMKELPLTRGHNADLAQDWTELHHEIVFEVRDECWPPED